MKNLLLMIALLLGGALSQKAFAGQQQNISMHFVNESGLGGGNTLAPARPWYIIQNDYELTLPSFEDDYTLELLDEDGTVVYATYLYAGTTTVVLPSTLSGDFELRLVPFYATYHYRGYLTL